MTALCTAISFLLLALDKIGQPIPNVLTAVVLFITAVLWLVSAAGVNLPALHR